MPSGAKKRKAAKKKLQEKAHNTNTNTNPNSNDDVSHNHNQGTDNAKTHDERESDGVNNHQEGAKEVRLGDENVGEYSKEVKSEENFNDVKEVNAGDDFRGSKNGKHNNSSSSGSSSEDDEVPIEKEKPVAAETGEVEQQVSSSFSEVSRVNPVVSEVYNMIEEKIPFQESVKQVVSLPQEVNIGGQSVAVDNSMISHAVESELKQKLVDEDGKFSSGPTDLVEEKIETKVIEAVDNGLENVSESVDGAARDGEGLPESCDVRSADAWCEDSHSKEVETHKYVEEQPLISSAPLPVRRTSLLNCCGLFEAFSGGASR